MIIHEALMQFGSGLGSSLSTMTKIPLPWSDRKGVEFSVQVLEAQADGDVQVYLGPTPTPTALLMRIPALASELPCRPVQRLNPGSEVYVLANCASRVTVLVKLHSRED